MYCVYETLYFGDKLPPRYIGSTTVARVMNGYHGSVLSKQYKEVFREELRENPDLFYTVILSRVSTRREAFAEEHRLQTDRDVVNSPFYMNKTIVTPDGKYSNFGTHHTEETKEKISRAHIGMKHSPATKAKLSAFMKTKGDPGLGKYHTQDTRRKMRAAKLGKQLTEDHKLKIAAGNMGKIVSDETRAKLSAAAKRRYEAQ